MADNYCACNGGDDAEYIIELNQQGPPGVQGEQGEQGYSPVVSYTVNNDTIQFTLVNQDTTSTTPNFYEYVAKKSVVDNHGVLIQNNTNAIDDLELNKLDKDGSNADSNFTINNLPILTFGTIGSRLGNGSQLPTLALQARNINIQGYNSNDQRVNFIGLNSNGVINISASNLLVMSGSSDRPTYNNNSLALLTDIPSIPTVGNGTITLTQGGVIKGTFTTNQSGNTTIELDAGGGAITNPLIIDDEDSNWSMRMGIGVVYGSRRAFMQINESPAIGYPIEMINSATSPVQLKDLFFGLKTIALNYDNNTLKVNQNGQLYADISAPTYTAGTGIDITNEEISVDSDYIEAHKAYLADGDLLTDEDGLEDVKYYNYSTFDISKFAILGSPNITDDGIVSRFSTSNYIAIPPIALGNNFKLYLPFTLPNPISATQIYRMQKGGAFRFLLTIGSNSNVYFNMQDDNGVNPGALNILNTNEGVAGDSYIAVIELKNGTLIYGYIHNGVYTQKGTTTSELNFTTAIDRIFIGRGSSEGYNGSIDLKQFSIYVNDEEIISGNQTGTDTYEINNTTITIPYTVSKTGAKIVKSKYRNEVTSVYNNQGYALYYTLDEANNNFTLPMGEIYGYITRLEGIVKDLQTRLTALESNIDAGGAGVVQQSLLGMSPLSLGRPQLLGEFNPEDEMNTMDIEPIEDDIQEEELEPQETENEGGENE